MAHAYLIGDKRDTLTTWLDRPWGKADLYSIQKIVATIQALPAVPDFSTSKKSANPTAPAAGAPIIYEITVHNTGLALSDAVRVEDIIPDELTFINGSASATPNIGALQMSGKNFTWEGVLPSSGLVTLRFQATASVAQGQSKVITNTARIIAPGVSDTMRSARVFVNGRVTNLPVVRR
ncbi:MAG: DUF11 domain-containing protein [Anaerolineaceae bacterium]|nr:DUF11 domain-containing protein [Anaerolineaceae bacterium]